MTSPNSAVESKSAVPLKAFLNWKDCKFFVGSKKEKDKEPLS
jgi:hypothetical protein